MTMRLSFYDIENWLLLRIMRGTKRLNPFFRLHETSEVLSFSPVPSPWGGALVDLAHTNKAPKATVQISGIFV